MKLNCALIAALLMCSCGDAPNVRKSKLYPAGEKATVGPLTYSIVDTQTLPRLGEDAATARVPQQRFFLVQLAISNGGNMDAPIPAMTLVDESGKTYPELADGAGVPQWMGVVRRVSPGGTEQGNIAFDAPAAHMKLKLTEEADDADVMVDLPLSFAHEQANAAPATSVGPQQQQQPAPLPPAKK